MNDLISFEFYSFPLRIQGMLLRLEFEERKTEIQQSLDTLHEAIDGNWLYSYMTAISMLHVIDCLQKYLHLIH